MDTKVPSSGGIETLEGRPRELVPDCENIKIDASPSSSKTLGPRLALITGMLMEKNKPNADESDQDSVLDAENPKGVNSLPSLRFGKQGLVTMSGKRPGSFSTRSAADRNDPSSSIVTDADIRKFVFLQSRSKRLTNGLKVHSLNKQTFLSSFSVGIVLGIIIALTCKLLSEFIFGRVTMLPRSFRSI